MYAKYRYEYTGIRTSISVSEPRRTVIAKWELEILVIQPCNCNMLTVNPGCDRDRGHDRVTVGFSVVSHGS